MVWEDAGFEPETAGPQLVRNQWPLFNNVSFRKEPVHYHMPDVPFSELGGLVIAERVRSGEGAGGVDAGERD